jgi:hypothetical protein
MDSETRTDGEKEERRKKLGNASYARQQIPAGSVVGKHEPGEESADDGGHANLR